MKNANRAESASQTRESKGKALAPQQPSPQEQRESSKNSRAHREASNTEAASPLSGDTVGIDVGDLVSQFCRLDAAGEIAAEGRLHTNAASIEKHFARLPKALIALEAGTHSGWIARTGVSVR